MPLYACTVPTTALRWNVRQPSARAQVIQQFEFRSRALADQARGRKFNVLITTYELVLKDADLLRERCEWAYLLVDEAHRLKNNESALYKVLLAQHVFGIQGLGFWV